MVLWEPACNELAVACSVFGTERWGLFGQKLCFCKEAAGFLKDSTHVPQHLQWTSLPVVLTGTEQDWSLSHREYRALCNFHSSHCNYRSTTPAPSDSALSMEHAAPSTALVLTPRSNPRHLFVSSQLPSTGAMPSISPSPTSAPSAPPQTANGQDDKPSSSKQPGTTSDAPPQRGHAGQRTSRDQQPADEMPEDDGSDDTGNLSDAQVKIRPPAADPVALGHDAYVEMRASDDKVYHSSTTEGWLRSCSSKWSMIDPSSLGFAGGLVISVYLWRGSMPCSPDKT